MKVFENQTSKSWGEKVSVDLKGKPIDSLQVDIGDQVRLAPVYMADQRIAGASIRWNPDQVGWHNTLRIQVEDASETALRLMNESIRSALAGGIEGLDMKLDAMDSEQLEMLFEEVYLEMISLRIDCDEMTAAALRAMLASYSERNRKEILSCSINPRCIDFPVSDEADLHIVAPCRQLAQAIESGIDYGDIVLRMTIGNHIFKELAKIRAMKLLVYAMAEHLQKPLTRYPVFQVIVQHDAIEEELEVAIEWTNKATIAAFGGVDEIVVDGLFSSAFPIDEEDKKRLARSVHHLLKLESNLHAYSDVFGGAYWIEKATQEIVMTTWEKIIGGES